MTARIYKPKKTYKRERYGKNKENHKYYNSSKWVNLRNDYLQKNPLCEMCLNPDIPNEDGECYSKVKEAEEIHHKIEISQNSELAYCWDNLMSLCKWHHHYTHNEKRKK